MLALISITQPRGTTGQALIKFVQLIPKRHHDTVKQQAAEEPAGNMTNQYTSTLSPGVSPAPTSAKTRVNRIPEPLKYKELVRQKDIS